MKFEILNLSDLDFIESCFKCVMKLNGIIKWK